MARNGDELVQLYNEIDDWLRKRAGTDNHDGFAARLVLVGEREAVLRPHVGFLTDVARLRNAIVHDRAYPAAIVADPRDRLIRRLRQVCDAILKPQLLRTFGSIPVMLKDDRPLREALAIMRERDFSQIVIERSDRFNLLSSEGILRWLESHAAKEGWVVDVEESALGKVAQHEPEGSCAWLAASRPVAEAVERFARVRPDGAARLVCILVSEGGRPTQRPLRLVTPWDIARD